MAIRTTIRIAGPADRFRLAALARRTFRETFAADNDPADLAAYLDQAFAPEVVAAELRQAANTFFLAETNAPVVPVGYTKLREDSAEPCLAGDRPIELERIYVDAAALGTGTGSALLERCLDRAVARGHDSLWLGVWKKNQRAIRFYQRSGFEVVGTHGFQVGADLQTDLVMERRL